MKKSCEKCSKIFETVKCRFCSEECRKSSKAEKLSKSYLKYWEDKRGKSYEELYGEETAKKLKEERSKVSKRPKSREHLKNIGKALRGRIFTPEWKAKLKEKRNLRTIEKVSKVETLILNEMEKFLGLKIDRQFRVEGRSFDGRLNNCLIEIDGKYWHSLPEAKVNDAEKNNIAKRNGYVLTRISVDERMNISSEIFR